MNISDTLDEVSPLFVNATKLILSEALYWKNMSHWPLLLRNRYLRRERETSKLFICATGPSIKSLDLTMLKNYDVASISNFFLHERISEINPKFQFFAPYHKPLIEDNFLNWIASADRVLPPRTNFILALSDYNRIKNAGLLKQRKKWFLSCSYNTPHRSLITRYIKKPNTGPQMALPVAAYLKYEQIYLLGCDHTILRDYKRTRNNFYDKSQDVRINATDANSWPPIIQELQFNLKTFKAYKRWSDLNIHVISNDSWLDQFPFMSLEEATGHKIVK